MGVKGGWGTHQSERCVNAPGHTVIRATLIMKDFSQEYKAGLNILGQIIHFSCFHTPEFQPENGATNPKVVAALICANARAVLV